MTKVKIQPGICGFTAIVTAHSEDMQNAAVTVESGCGAIQKLLETTGGSLDAFDVCFARPGAGALYEAAKNLPIHAGCPVLAGIAKCVEAECGLALRQDAAISFME